MASARRVLAGRLAGIRRVCVLAAAVASVAGCAGMPQGGPVGTFSAGQGNTAQNPAADDGPFFSGPTSGATPQEIVQGFLTASAYPADAVIAREFLTSPAGGAWNPGWSATVLQGAPSVSRSARFVTGGHGSSRALVEVTGSIQAMVNSSGQDVSAPVGGARYSYQFSLVKANGQWRISNPPGQTRLINAFDFSHVYRAQDLYFFDPSYHVLVPFSVFVPEGIPESPNLVQALAQGPSTTWLQGAVKSRFPAGTKILSVSSYGSTVTVNLSGSVAATNAMTREQLLAQLVWTLAGPSASASPSLPGVQSVVLEINGQQWTPPGSPCASAQGQLPSAFQKLASYECYNPYPAAPASFAYVASGQPLSRCGSETQGEVSSIGSVESVFGGNGAAAARQCAEHGTGSSAKPPGGVSTAPLSLVAVSPDGKYVAGVSAGRNMLFTGAASGTATAFSGSERLKNNPGITAISWDRSSELWVAQNGGIWMLPASEDNRYQVAPAFDGQVSALSVAPDGVRLAAIVQDGSVSEVELAAIVRRSQPGSPRGSQLVPVSIGQVIQLGPNLTDPISLTWYNANTLIVLNAASTGNTLWSVPTDGDSAQPLAVTPPGAVSITADSSANALIAGLSDGTLDYATSIAGPWNDLSAGGSNPAYTG
jgi:Lipoprotein LpqB beta-propeller domain/Sporulation and spore germination